MAGPPYEDIAFRIVDREWDYSAKRERGFKSSFDKVSSFACTTWTWITGLTTLAGHAASSLTVQEGLLSKITILRSPIRSFFISISYDTVARSNPDSRRGLRVAEIHKHHELQQLPLISL